jgi:hypothetical protein
MQLGINGSLIFGVVGRIMCDDSLLMEMTDRNGYAKEDLYDRKPSVVTKIPESNHENIEVFCLPI